MKSSLARRYRRKHRTEDMRSNPPLVTDVALFVGPGFGGYAATRIVSRIAANQVTRLRPSLGKHAGALASLATFAATWLLAHRWKPLERYHTPLVVGAGIATLQTLVQTYLPQIGWIMDLPAPTAAAQLPAPAAQGALSPDNNAFFYNDMFDAGVYAGQAPPGAEVPGSPAAAQEAASHIDTLSDLMADLGADGIGMAGDAGIFTN